MKIKQSNTQNPAKGTIQFDKSKILTRNAVRRFGRDITHMVPMNLVKKKMTKTPSKPKQIEAEVAPHLVYQKQIVSRILHLQECDPGFKINHNYLTHHKIFDKKLRMFLVKYLYKISMRFSLKRTTLFLAVFYFDKYLESEPNAKQQTALLAVQASMFIAMKYEEIYPPDLVEWAGAKSKVHVLEMEADILKTLDFKLAQFTLQHFYEYEKSKRPCLNNEIESFILYLLDLSLFDLNMYQFKPSALLENIILSVLAEKGLLSKKEAGKLSERMLNHIKWMMERNPAVNGWLNGHCLRRGSVPGEDIFSTVLE